MGYRRDDGQPEPPYECLIGAGDGAFQLAGALAVVIPDALLRRRDHRAPATPYLLRTSAART